LCFPRRGGHRAGHTSRTSGVHTVTPLSSLESWIHCCRVLYCNVIKIIFKQTVQYWTDTLAAVEGRGRRYQGRLDFILILLLFFDCIILPYAANPIIRCDLLHSQNVQHFYTMNVKPQGSTPIAPRTISGFGMRHRLLSCTNRNPISKLRTFWLAHAEDGVKCAFFIACIVTVTP
jgi:hypothetical protein